MFHYRIITVGSFEMLIVLLQITVEVSNAVSAAVDGIIATSMIYYLYRGQTGQERSACFLVLLTYHH